MAARRRRVLLVRYAIVATLESGKRATYSKRGRVDWCKDRADAEKVLATVAAAQAAVPCRRGYALPDYSIFGDERILGPNIDANVNVEMITENRWRAKYDHTVPFHLTR